MMIGDMARETQPTSNGDNSHRPMRPPGDQTVNEPRHSTAGSTNMTTTDTTPLPTDPINRVNSLTNQYG